jgi:hypothetical protein
MVALFWMDALPRLSSDVHLLRLFDLRGMVGTEDGFAGCHTGDVAHFGECSHPVFFQFAHVCSIAGRRFHSP